MPLSIKLAHYITDESDKKRGSFAKKKGFLRRKRFSKEKRKRGR